MNGAEVVTETAGWRSAVTYVPRNGLRPAHWTWHLISTDKVTTAARYGWALTERGAWRRASRAHTRAVNS
jgi:hypothetical protein